MAYRLEADGSRIYLCENHVPFEEKEDTVIPKLRLVQPPRPETDQG
jgi:hypothetical protein